MVAANTFNQFLVNLFPVIHDYGPNGWQVEGERDIKKLVTGVTACQALIDEAIAAEADAIFVHHGIFWDNDAIKTLVGMKGRRVRALMKAGVHLFAYHLPLDLHPTLGNNVQLALRLGVTCADGVDALGLPSMVRWGRLEQPTSLDDWAKHCEQVLDRSVLAVTGGDHLIERLAWCTGGAQDCIVDAIAMGADAYLTGETSERTVHQAREMGIHLLVAGHHATERYGVQAVGEHCAEHFGIEHQFIDIDNPV